MFIDTDSESESHTSSELVDDEVATVSCGGDREVAMVSDDEVAMASDDVETEDTLTAEEIGMEEGEGEEERGETIVGKGLLVN